MGATFLAGQPAASSATASPALPASAVQNAGMNFINAMQSRDMATVWLYATEEEQDAFGTEQAMYEAYSEEFPFLTLARSAIAEREWQEGDASFVEVKISDANHNEYTATMGFWLSDSSDWQLISCDVQPASDWVASR
jgi:hypothetical protein